MDGGPRLLLCAPAGGSRGLADAAAAVAVAATPVDGAPPRTLVVDLRDDARRPRGTVLASAAARELEARLRAGGPLRGAARGRLCFAGAVAADAGPEEALGWALAEEVGADLVVAVCESADFRTLLEAGATVRRAVLVRAERGAGRPLIALLAAELRGRGIPIKAWVAPIGAIGGRRALAGLEPGGDSGRRARRLAAMLVPRPGVGPAGRAG
ncbi:MAG: hypothetical protein KJ006_04515 [Thermoleophilia bacterium]|nr:hypothetical protein [Thermoleophilia bacterium]